MNAPPHQLESYLCGRWRRGEGVETELVDPVSGAVLATASAKGLDLGEALVFARQHGQSALRGMTYAARAKLVGAIADVLAANRAKYEAIAIANSGNTKADAAIDIDGGIGTLKYYARLGLGMPSLEAAAAALKVVPIPAPVHSDLEIETAIIALGRKPGGGLVVMPDGGFTAVHRAPIILAAARNKVPAVYVASYYARDGGLLSYGVDLVDNFRRAAAYVDRILRGAKPGDLPVQLPTKFEMVVNRKTANALGLRVPPSILLRADEVIE